MHASDSGTARAPGDGRFLPGTILAARYRIIGLLGRGGMGEVYRADDLKLGQAVALKLLPPGFEADADRLRRFLDEVRTARQVSHANVCRIYDAGEANGLHFLSMEYVDGEDLASLLRRIGRLPEEKALQIARQLCAGLAASHEAGVLHRDLKPANVMIDGRGRARITDFGLAGLAEEFRGDEIRAGTPAYMAPEQVEGREVTAKSDLYALGLVLYELFTGKRPSSPSSHVDGFNPAIEKVILRCLERDPARRPASALSIAAALPGGDPIAAALAAGETPSPEMVAEAADEGALSPVASWGVLGVFFAALLVFVALASRKALVGQVPLEKPPDFLRERAREILVAAGEARRPTDTMSGFAAEDDYLEDLRRRINEGRGSWGELRETPPSAVSFWYRQSPAPMVPLGAGFISQGLIDPPYTVPGMARVVLDADGRLRSLVVVPGQKTESTGAADHDWEPLIRTTGVDPATLTAVPPDWAPPVFADRRLAWTASWPGREAARVRIEAASFGGKPVSIQVVEPWTRPAEAPKPPQGFWRQASSLLNTLAFIFVAIAAAIVAWRNVRRGRGDRRGALRFALYLGGVRMAWYVGVHHVAAAEELEIFVGHLSYAMQRVGLAYVFYLAVEPYARKLWPRMLVSWVRILDGRWRDPLVGRDLLVGAAGGALAVLVGWLSAWIPEAMGGTAALPVSAPLTMEFLRDPRSAAMAMLAVHTKQLNEIIFPITLFLMFRLLFRHMVPAVIAVSLCGILLFLPDSGSVPGFLIGFAVVLALAWLLLLRFGLLAFAAYFCTAGLIEQAPLSLSPSSWYAGSMLLALLFIVAPALWGFWTSRGRRSLPASARVAG
jgi:serine/threonine-protein kinase